MQPSCISSGAITADTVVAQGRSLYHGMSVRASGAGNAGVRIHDGVDSSGKLIDKLTVLSGSSDLFHNFNRPVRAENGLFVDVDADTEVIIYFG